jgi:putative ABC transport system permease protein
MIKSYFKIAWRNLKKNRLYTVINITGLTVGIVSCLLIGIYIRHELSYDRFNQNADKIARVTMEYSFGDELQKTAGTVPKVGPQFKMAFPGVTDFVRLFKNTKIIGRNEQLFAEENFLYADPSFFKIFSFKLSKGEPANVLDAPDKIVITQIAAKKYFGNEDPIGKVLKVDSENFMVSGVAAGVPSNSQVQFDFVIPFDDLPEVKVDKGWMDGAHYITYLQLKNNNQLQPLQNQITGYMKRFREGNQYATFRLEPLTSIHLHSKIPYGLEPNGSIVYIYILAIVALLILTIACVNYINLSIAQSSGRGAEIGIRKVLGAARQQLIKQFIGESLLVTAIAVLLAIALAGILLPVFNQISGKQLQLNVLFDPVILICLVSLGFIIGLAAGAYPALLLSGTKLTKILKSGFSFTSGMGVRRSLIIFQFIISIFLIVTTIIILQQLAYIRNKDIGYNRSNVVVLPVKQSMLPRIQALKNAIRNIAGVEGVAAANREPVHITWSDVINTQNGKGSSVNVLAMDEDFVKTMQLKIVAGSDFDHTDVLQNDPANQNKDFHYSFMLNESAVRKLGWTPEQAIGKDLFKVFAFPGTIKAVVKDFNFKSFHDPISPLLMFFDYSRTQALFVRITGNNTSAALKSLQLVWNERVPTLPFEYKFMDDEYDAVYRTEQRTASVFTAFSVLAILLAFLGLFAVVAYAVVQRTKEIGIRKVLGANVSGIIMLINKIFLWLIIIASAIASPIAWYVSNKWLQDFAYRVTINWWIFIAAAASALVIAGFTISAQAIKAALANPVDSLRSE